MNLRPFLIAAAASAVLLRAAAETPPPSPALTNSPGTVLTNGTPTNLVAPTNITALIPFRPLPECSTDATNAFRSITLRAGFKIQLAAAEPLVTDPVAIAFDADGRLYVAEQPGNGLQGRIKLLEDTDGDGIFDSSFTFAVNLPPPTALICYGDGVFVAAGAKILFLAPTNGSSVAGAPREIFTGFAITNSLQPGEGLNSFTWGPDNLIHAAAAGIGGNISCVAMQTTRPLALLDSDFAFDPKSLTMIAEPGDASLGISFDNAGRRFTCNATRPFIGTLCDSASAARNPLYLWPQITADLAPRPFYIFPPKPAAQTNTSGSTSKTNITQASRPTQLTQAGSLLVYRGGALGSPMAGSAFVTDPALGIVSRLQLRANGFFPAAERPRSESASEFLSSRDPSFRPVQTVSGPDGSLYVVDVARANLDEPANNGRIWRILPLGASPQKPPQLSALKTHELVAHLANPSGWIRDTAARLLFERADTNAVPLLQNQLARSSSPVARLLSLHALQSRNALTEAAVITALRDRDESVRELAAQFAGLFVVNGSVSNPLWNTLLRASGDASLRVRLKVALTLGLVQRSAVLPVLAGMIRSAPDQRILQFAVLTAAERREDGLLLEFFRDPRVMQIPGGREFILELATMAGMTSNGRADEMLKSLDISRFPQAEAYAIAHALGEGLQRSGRNFLSAAPAGTARVFADGAMNIAMSPGSPEVRAAAIRFLSVSGYTSREIGDWTLALLAPGEAQVVESAVIDTLASFPDPAITSAFIQRWRGLTATSQAQIIARMLERYDRTMALMTALEERRIPATALSDVQVNLLRSNRDSHTAARAVKFFGPAVQSGLAERYAPVLHLAGSAARGHQVFTARCASCHRLGDEGAAFGPDLDNAVRRGRAKLLEDILEPGREIRAGYKTKIIQRMNSELLYGIVSDTGRNVHLVRRPGRANYFLPAKQVADSADGDWSMMPQDAAAGLSATALADLLEFLAPGKR